MQVDVGAVVDGARAVEVSLWLELPMGYGCRRECVRVCDRGRVHSQRRHYGRVWPQGGDDRPAVRVC